MTLPEKGKVGLISAISLGFPFIGSGSRTALFVWGAFAVRRLSIWMFIVMLLGALVVSQIPGLMIFSKLADSLSELTTPLPESGVGFSLRAMEGLIFVGWWQESSWLQRLFGADEMIFLPGPLIGREVDPPFVPHNAIAGMIFQFGLVGVAIILAYFRSLWVHMRAVPPARYLFFALLIPGFIVAAGFVTVDYAVLAAVVNGLIVRHGRVKA